MRIKRACFLLPLLMAGPLAVSAQDLMTQRWPDRSSAIIEIEANCTVHTFNVRFSDERVAALICRGPNFDSAFRLDAYEDGTARLHLFDFTYIDPRAKAVQYQVGWHDAQIDEETSRSLSEYARSLDFNEEAYRLFVDQVADSPGSSLLYQIEDLPVRSVPLPDDMDTVLGQFQTIQQAPSFQTFR